MKRSENLFTRIWYGVAMLSVILFVVACDKNEDNTPVQFDAQDQAVMEGEESAETLFDVVESVTNAALNVSDANTSGRIEANTEPELACANVTFTGTKQSGRVEIDFGEGCKGPDGRIRKGIIVVEYEGYWLNKDAKIYTVLKDFYVDDHKVEGTRILTNVSLDLSSLVYTVELIGGKVTWPDSTFITRESDRTHTIVFGTSKSDFQLYVEGEASGTTRKGVSYMTNTVQPLVFKSSCLASAIYLPISGVKTISIPDKPLITINYGSGDCDNTILVTIGDKSKELTF